jgi:hypothetical protein
MPRLGGALAAGDQLSEKPLAVRNAIMRNGPARCEGLAAPAREIGHRLAG